LVLITLRIPDVNCVLRLLNHADVGNVSDIRGICCLHLQGQSLYGGEVSVYTWDPVLKNNGVRGDVACLGQQRQWTGTAEQLALLQAMEYTKKTIIK
jgi:hypothetical protein